jgi:hypothetical protein
LGLQPTFKAQTNPSKTKTVALDIRYPFNPPTALRFLR